MPIGEHAPRSTTVVLTDDLTAIQAQVAAVRRHVASNGRMNRDDKVAVYTKLQAIDKICIRNIQLSLFSPEQRSHG